MALTKVIHPDTAIVNTVIETSIVVAPPPPATTIGGGDACVATTEVINPDVILLDMFNPEKLTTYDEHQVAWWDESHRKCSLVTISGANGCEYITRVCRDHHNNPTLDVQQSQDAPVNVNVKYEKEARPGEDE